jgi:ABC-type multidrug transport system ATPase subunit
VDFDTDDAVGEGAKPNEHGAPSADTPTAAAEPRVLSKATPHAMSVDLAHHIDNFLHVPVSIDFTNLTLSVSNGSQIILKRAYGHVQQNQMMAVMGASGSGKSSLLKALVGKFDGFTQGYILVNGTAVTGSPLTSRLAVYVEQDDTLYGQLTVAETFYYAAHLQLMHASDDIIDLRIADVMTGLRLEHCANVKVNALSGGERRRVSIGANGLLTPARLLVVDEPTTGLSATDALELIQILSELCKRFHFTVIATIHQPRTEIFECFDRLMLLSHGTTVYSGPQEDVVKVFGAAGITLRGGDDSKVAESMMEVLADKDQADVVYQYVHANVNPVANPSVGEDLTRTTSRQQFSRTMRTEFWLLMRRSTVLQLRSSSAFEMFIFNNIACATFQSILYFRINNDAENIQSKVGALWACMSTYILLCLNASFYHMETFEVHRHDIPAGRHSLFSLMMADMVVGFLRMAAVGVAFTVIMYFGVGFERSVPHFADFCFAGIAMGCFADALCIVLLYASFNGGFMTSFAGPIFTQFGLLNGFFVKPQNMPYVLRWVPEVSPIRAGLELMLSSHFNNQQFGCGDVLPMDQTVPCPMDGDVALRALGFHSDRRTRNVWILVVAPILLRVLAFGLFKMHTRHKGYTEAPASLTTASDSEAEFEFNNIRFSNPVAVDRDRATFEPDEVSIASSR